MSAPADATAELLSRPRLERTLDAALTRRLACVVAGAGFGKTLLLRSWSVGRSCAWHSLTARDRTASVLAGAILDALDEHVSDLPAELAAVISASDDPDGDDGRRAGVIAALLGKALTACLQRDVVLILDDAHQLEPGSGGARLIEGLCRQTPAALHVVLAGQAEPPFRIDRLRGYGEVLDVTAAELAFTPDETAELLVTATPSGPAQLAQRLWDATGGWPVAVRLAVDMLADLPADAQEQVVEGVRLAEGPLFDYLAREVFDREPFVVRELVRTTAACGQISVALSAELGLPEAAGHLASLTRRGLLVQQTEPGVGNGSSAPVTPPRYALVPLAREFALKHFPVDAWELQELRSHAADWFAAQHDTVSALESLLAISAHDRVLSLLTDHGAELLRRGEVTALIRAADAVAPGVLEAQHWRLLGEALQVRGDWDRALSCFRQASSGTGRLDSGLAWRMGVIHYFRGDLDEAVSLYQQGMPTDDSPGSRADDARLLAWMASAHWIKGDPVACGELLERAMRLATDAADDRALAAVHTTKAMLAVLEGDRAANDRHFRLALEHAQRAGDVLQTIRIRVNRASHCQDEGRYDEALAELEEAIPMADLAGFAAFQALGLHNRGDTYRCLGRLDEAVADFEAAKQHYQRIGSQNVHNPLRGLGDVYLARGDLALARVCYEEAIQLAAPGPDLQTLVPALAGLARALAVDEPATAKQLAERAMSYGPGFGHTAALLAASRLALAAGDPARAMELANQTATQARRQRDRAGLAEALELQATTAPEPQRAHLLEQAGAIWRELGNPIGTMRVSLLVAEQLGDPAGRALAESVARAAAELGAHGYAQAASDLLHTFEQARPPKVAIRVLGNFQVLHDGTPIAAGTWQSKKARDLLKILIARRGRPISRMALMAALWPDMEPSRLANRLSVALSTVRSVLDPDKEHGPAHLVPADAESVRLDNTQVEIDVENFLADATASLARRRAGGSAATTRALASAEAAYTGDVLEENPYEDWATPLREEAKATYLQVLRALADDAADAADHGAVARYQLRILERDPFDERAHLEMVRVLEETGSHGEARRRYQAYTERMAEIDVEAAPFPAAS